LTKRVFFYQLILAFFQEHYRPENYNPLNLKEKIKNYRFCQKMACFLDYCMPTTGPDVFYKQVIFNFWEVF